MEVVSHVRGEDIISYSKTNACNDEKQTESTQTQLQQTTAKRYNISRHMFPLTGRPVADPQVFQIPVKFSKFAVGIIGGPEMEQDAVSGS